MAAVRPPAAVHRGLLTSWRGIVWCHVPADEPLDLDRLVTIDGSDDRWNGPGEPTLYLALDIATALAELARHLDLLPSPRWRRRLIGMHVDLDGLADLRRPELQSAVGIGDVAALRDRDRARAAARRIRDDEHAQGLIVPSIAFLDDAGHGNLVVFADRLRDGVEALLGDPVEAGVIELAAPQNGT
jgi:RES domain-containing protein